jgi:hypothetical protein
MLMRFWRLPVGSRATLEIVMFYFLHCFISQSHCCLHGNFFGCQSSDDWAEQKYLESLGRREVYDYGKELPTERVLLTSTWAITVSLLLGRVVWQVSW